MILNWALSLVSAALLVCLFPGINFAWLAPIALTPLLIACAREPDWRFRFAMGYAAGIVYWFGLCNWIEWTLAHHAGVSPAVAWMLFALFCLAKAFQMGVFAVLAGPMMGKAWAPPVIASLWVAIDWTHSYTGFEWLSLGNAASEMSVPLRLAPFTGVWGLSFLFALIACTAAGAVLRRRRIAMLWLLPMPGLFLLPEIPPLQPGSANAVVVQPNIDDDTQWTRELLREVGMQMRALSLAVGPKGPRPIDIIVWPEVPAPFENDDREFTGLISSIARTARSGLLADVIGRAPDGQPLNSGLLLNAEGTAISRYDKVNLVPFGEFVPWPFGLLTRKVSNEAGDFEAGKDIVVSKIGGHRIATFICYESVFPSYIRRFAAAGAEVLFNISNDSWFGKSSARYQHLQIVRMRAAENRRWIVRATNNGVSATIDPAGRLVKMLPEYREVAGRMPYEYRTDVTLYARFGDWFVLLCALLAGSAVMSGVLPARRRL